MSEFPGFDPTRDHRPFVEDEQIEVTLTIEARVPGRLVNVSADGESCDVETEPITKDTVYTIIGTVIHRTEEP